MREVCDGCGEEREVETGLCINCLSSLVCCSSPEEAAATLCGCKGGAAVALRQLRERLEV